MMRGVRSLGPIAASACLALALAARGAAQAPVPSPDAPVADVVTPPRVLASSTPTCPAPCEGGPPTVAFTVTIGEDGVVIDAAPTEVVPPELEVLAREALAGFRFAPATRNGAPVPARVRVAVQFAAPTPSPDPVPATPPAAQSPDAPPVPAPDEGLDHASTPATTVDDDGHLEDEDAHSDEPLFDARASIELERLRAGDRAASDFELERRVLELAPHAGAAEMLRAAPGMFVARPEGDAVAHRIVLRGFDAEHGQDLELTVGGVPINQPSHIHGQGYADLGFVIPETVRRVRVTEGVYDPRQGDFAVAGSADFTLGVDRRGLTFRSQLGSFRTFRQVAIWAPPSFGPSTFAAAQIRRSDGFGDNRASASGSALAQIAMGEGHWRYRLFGAVHGARGDIAGVVREDDVDAGRVGFYGTYDLPTAQAQNAYAMRALAAFTAEHRARDGSNDDFALWAGFTDFRSQTNFTGFAEISRFEPTWTGRGDLNEQTNRTTTVGVRARHRSRPYEPAGFLHGHFELGLQARLDRTAQAQRLIQAPQNQVWDERVDATILFGDVGVWMDLDLEIGEHVRVRGGARADALFFDVDDALGNFIPSYRGETYIVGHRRTAFGVVAGPRFTLEYAPTDHVQVLAAYGEGFRSPQARTLADGERAPFTKVRSADLGTRFTFGDRAQHRITATGFFTQLTDDVIFDPEGARYERIGPTRRAGLVAAVQTEPTSFLLASASLTWVRATLLEPPLATTSDPDPAFEEGQLLPYVPPVVLRLDLGAYGDLARGERNGLVGRVGVGYSLVGRRPLPYSERAAMINLLDAQASLTFERGEHQVELGLEASNIIGTRWSASEYLFTSNWDPSAVPSRVPMRHFAAGAPRTVLLTLGLTL